MSLHIMNVYEQSPDKQTGKKHHEDVLAGLVNHSTTLIMWNWQSASSRCSQAGICFKAG